MIVERLAVQRGKEILLRWDPGEPLSRFFFSNGGGGRKSLADQVRKWELEVQSLDQAKLRVAKIQDRAKQEGITKQTEAFCRKYRVTPEEFEAMFSLSEEDRRDILPFLESGQARSYQHALDLLVQLRQSQEDETDGKIDELGNEINYGGVWRGGGLGKRVAKEYRAEHPWQGKTREYVQELYNNWKRWKNWQAEDDSSFDIFQSEWLLAQEGRLHEHVTNPFPFP